MSQVTPKRRDKFVASCNFCGTFLQETQGDCKCNVVCPCCRKNMAVVVRKGKVRSLRKDIMRMTRHTSSRSEL